MTTDDEAEVRAKAEELGLGQPGGKDHDVAPLRGFPEVVEDRLDGPIFVIDYPAAICPLTKRKAGDPNVAERFELFVRGMELANAYTDFERPYSAARSRSSASSQAAEGRGLDGKSGRRLRPRSETRRCPRPAPASASTGSACC